MLFARFFIYRCKYSKSKLNMLEFFNELNMFKKPEYLINLRQVTIYLLTSCNTEERIAQNIYIHNSNRNYKN